MWDEALLGLAVGILCGSLPLAFGFLTKHKIPGIVGMVATAAFGVIFALTGETPFTSVSVALVFVIFIFASNKRKHKNNHNDNDDFYDDGHI